MCFFFNFKNIIIFLIFIGCGLGWYGFGCSEKCGYCFDLYYCYYKMGLCLIGCVVGYEGCMCNISRFMYFM